MSFTTTLQTITKSGILHLNSPNKEPKISTENSDIGKAPPKHSEIVRWTFRKEAIAPCFIRDVFELRDDSAGDFYWLGRVPCRTVMIVGIVVGIVQHDDSTHYSMDDGTGVIDCIHKHDKQPVTPKRFSKKTVTQVRALPNLPPPPIAEIGAPICIKGRVCRGRGSKYLRVDTANIVKCSSLNDEPRHWMNVVNLHKESYSSSEPFSIPPLADGHLLNPTTDPSSSGMPPSSPVTIASSSPVRGEADTQNSIASGHHASHPRLRHPSRLHFRDLNVNTFRIYMKHYIDNAPELRSTPEDSLTLSQKVPSPDQRGFTLGYLRRVPELADMAKAVVRAERKRREREERKQQKEALARSQGKSMASSSTVKSPRRSSEPTSRKMKRLFTKAVRDLYAEGSIILWDGPKCLHGADYELDASMWKNSSSTPTTTLSALPESSIATSAINITARSQDCDSAAELSDEEPTEEAYIAVSVFQVAKLVEKAIGKLSRRANRIFRQGATDDGCSALESRSRHSSPPAAPEILAYLRASDEQWANLGEWMVKDALEFLCKEERVFKAGKGRWELCL